MKLGVMQPYFFPYLGYFQLIDSVDIFVFYTDVNFVKQSWMNRNSILGNDGKILFSMPLSNGKSNIKISDVKISENRKAWQKKIRRSLEYSYKKSANFAEGFDLVDECFSFEGNSLSEFNVNSITKICHWIGISTKIVKSSDGYGNQGMERVSRLIDICKQEKTNWYVNSPGGRMLYTQENFESSGIQLKFLNPKLKSYPQATKSFVPGLSIIDIIMNNQAADVKSLLSGYSIEN